MNDGTGEPEGAPPTGSSVREGDWAPGQDMPEACCQAHWVTEFVSESEAQALPEWCGECREAFFDELVRDSIEAKLGRVPTEAELVEYLLRYGN